MASMPAALICASLRPKTARLGQNGVMPQPPQPQPVQSVQQPVQRTASQFAPPIRPAQPQARPVLQRVGSAPSKLNTVFRPAVNWKPQSASSTTPAMSAAVVCASLLRKSKSTTQLPAPPSAGKPEPLPEPAVVPAAVVCAQMSLKKAPLGLAGSRPALATVAGSKQGTATVAGSKPPVVGLSKPVEKPWPNADGYRIVKNGVMQGETFGDSPWKLYEACAPNQLKEDPYFFIWLHGADGGGDIPPTDLVKMQKRLGRRVFFFVPISPKPAKDGTGGRFFWGVRYDKWQNKNDLGFIYGELHEPYMAAFCKLAQELSEEVGAIANLMSGYSMGGYGCWHFGSYMPDLFTAIIPVAGYGIGTTQKQGQYNAPQPESTQILRTFIQWAAPQLARIPIVIAVHAANDMTSYFPDTKLIVDNVKGLGGNASIAAIAADAADSDKGKRKIKCGHHYFNYALVNDSSEQVLYAQLRAGLQRITGQATNWNSGAKSTHWNGAGSAAGGRHGQTWDSSRSPRRADAADGGLISQLLSLV